MKKYKDLYNCVSFKLEEMDTINHEFKNKIFSYCCKGVCYNSHTISVDVVSDAINKLTHGKTDGYSNQMSDHFIHGTNKGNVFLSLLFQGMIIHGIIPDFF